mmetsp:Transcript_8080/g.18322  ORF Transcript_8080/g.18322 Transcript_8080/m.18322 type:complete len:114 (-) Transcript_8080:51-392(-)
MGTKNISTTSSRKNNRKKNRRRWFVPLGRGPSQRSRNEIAYERMQSRRQQKKHMRLPLLHRRSRRTTYANLDDTRSRFLLYGDDECCNFAPGTIIFCQASRRRLTTTTTNVRL